MMSKTLIIAEAGVNHNGDLSIASNMIDVAAEAGADVIKFQTFKAKNMVSRQAEKADYQKHTTGWHDSQFTMLKPLELDGNAHIDLLHHCKMRGITFLSTPFDMESIDLLHSLEISTIKISSGDITNLPLLKKIGTLNKQVILSTGMSTIGEIDKALSILITSGTPRDKITVLHCNTEYPTPFEDVNLNAMLSIKAAFPGIRIGYSDHTPGIEVAIAAVALGAQVIEKHFTLDKNSEGPDHKASLEPAELKAMITCIRNIECAMGNGIKLPSPSEQKNQKVARKSIVAKIPIKKGDFFNKNNITVKRPGTGINPMDWEKLIGQEAIKNFNPDEPIVVK